MGGVKKDFYIIWSELSKTRCPVQDIDCGLINGRYTSLYSIASTPTVKVARAIDSTSFCHDRAM